MSEGATILDFSEKPEPKPGLFVTDAELIRRLGVPEKIARDTIRALDVDKRSGFPRKQPLWGNRRYWPHVLAYLDVSGGLQSGFSRRTGNG